ncbi:DUF4381 domain-containing protein [Thiomicrorhabdus aquaedulcis]|uniref:DUF4381 domain-containing protein n=1 Tax=Thiomicrorhabdus aquaedulcis TaxID=2211106 RepID=UPI000FD9D76A|nr:DUF4381 domain-containing protein [Thiomicrorhabdus aquaedulcis]
MSNPSPNPVLTPESLNVLSQLHDIVLPQAVGWWPLAFSWWVLIFSVASMLIGLIWFFTDRHKRNAYRREALGLLSNINNDSSLNAHQKISAINRLLKQVALTAYGRHAVAVLTDQAWCDFLHQNAHYIKAPATLLACLNLAYQPVVSPTESQAALIIWHDYAKQWILGHHQ